MDEEKKPDMFVIGPHTAGAVEAARLATMRDENINLMNINPIVAAAEASLNQQVRARAAARGMLGLAMAVGGPNIAQGMRNVMDGRWLDNNGTALQDLLTSEGQANLVKVPTSGAFITAGQNTEDGRYYAAVMRATGNKLDPWKAYAKMNVGFDTFGDAVLRAAQDFPLVACLSEDGSTYHWPFYTEKLEARSQILTDADNRRKAKQQRRAERARKSEEGKARQQAENAFRAFDFSKWRRENNQNLVGPNQFKCEECDGIFDKGWTDEEAIKELEERFPGFKTDECGLVCDDCFNQFLTEND